MEAAFDTIGWIKSNFDLRESDSATFIYSTQKSLSTYAQPVIYVDWDLTNVRHYAHRGRIFDYAKVMKGRRVLDFGPGEGFPSLLLAEFVENVVGVDGSMTRVNECTENARRIGRLNTDFVHVPPGNPLPFPDESFGGAVASWSLEQSPDAIAAAREIYRVLEPKGILRFEPEPQSIYRYGQQQEVWLPPMMGDNNALTVFDRDFEKETTTHYGFLFEPGTANRLFHQIAERRNGGKDKALLTKSELETMKSLAIDAGTWKTTQPSLYSWVKHLKEIGFSTVMPTYSGAWFATHVFNQLAEEDRPKCLEEMDALLFPFAQIAHTMEAPSSPSSEMYMFVHAVK